MCDTHRLLHSSKECRLVQPARFVLLWAQPHWSAAVAVSARQSPQHLLSDMTHAAEGQTTLRDGDRPL